VAKPNLGEVVKDYGAQTGTPEAAKTLFLQGVRSPEAMARFLNEIKDPADKEAARQMIDKVKGMSDDEFGRFRDHLMADQKGTIDLARDGEGARGGDFAGKAGTAVAILVALSTAIAFAKSAHSEEAKPKKKVPFFSAN
jgi:hypothetical protein